MEAKSELEIKYKIRNIWWNSFLSEVKADDSYLAYRLYSRSTRVHFPSLHFELRCRCGFDDKFDFTNDIFYDRFRRIENHILLAHSDFIRTFRTLSVPRCTSLYRNWLLANDETTNLNKIVNARCMLETLVMEGLG